MGMLAAYPPALRVLKPADFSRTLSRGRRRKDALLSVTASPNGLKASRLGLAVSRRAGNAVARNRIKRLLREAFRLHRDTLPNGFDLVVSVQPGAKTWTLTEVSESLLKLASQAAVS